MGSVFKKTVTRPLPPEAEFITRQGVRLARWRDGRGKARTAPVMTGRDGTERIRDESSTYFARYRDGNGVVVEAPTGCRDESAARQVLADLERRAERVRAGLLTPAEARTAEHLATPIGVHVGAYLDALAAAGSVPLHRHNVETYLKRLAAECGFSRLSDLKREALERWLAERSGTRAGGRSARSRNTHRAALVAFCNWCVRTGRLTSNPFKGVPKANEAADPRRRRRAMSEDELVRLLEVARRRPLLDALTIRRGKRKGEAYANVRPEVRERLEAVGRERALIYKTLVLSGLRKGELASLTVVQLRLDGPVPHLELDAADEKNREGSGVVVRADLADDLRHWLADKLGALQTDARRRGEPIPARLPVDTPVFDVPAGLVRIFDRDLKLAGIPKRDERGRTLDVHALRTTFGTLLSRGGVPLRTAQAALRHSDPSLTANVYTDPKLLDVAGALDALPALPLGGGPGAGRERARATGTETYSLFPVALPVALTGGNGSEMVSNTGKMNTGGPTSAVAVPFAVSRDSGKTKGPLTSPVSGPVEYARQDLNLQPLAPEAAQSLQSIRCNSHLPKYMSQAHPFARGLVPSHIFAEKRGITGMNPVEIR
jgi:integrase